MSLDYLRARQKAYDILTARYQSLTERERMDPWIMYEHERVVAIINKLEGKMGIERPYNPLVDLV